MAYRIGVDVGGTFTDFSLFNAEGTELIHFKDSSTPDDPSKAIMHGIMHFMEELKIMPEEVSYLAHGTTVATNALIERKGARTGLITSEGFGDLMDIGWQKRPSMYDLRKQKPQSLIMSGMNKEVKERLAYDGQVYVPLDEETVRKTVRILRGAGVEAVAVCTLFSYINPMHENRIREILAEECPEMFVSISHKICPEFREYSRISTTVLNAYLGPVMKDYVYNFAESVKRTGIQIQPYVTQSNGAVISISETVECPIKTAVSGPSAGVIGAKHIGMLCGINDIITFDMGGTSIDVSLIENGKIQVSNERIVEGFPARMPMIDIVTLGAGGGSIARIDNGGALKVGPESAGAIPGPACYMRGGKIPTVTDANVVLGKLNSMRILGGRMEINASEAWKAIEQEICSKTTLDVERAAAGIVSVVNSNMAQAIRIISVERGYDARNFSLMAFGGAGPLHACEVAQGMGINNVIVPPSPGTLCSMGLLMADVKFDIVRSRILIAHTEATTIVAELYEAMMVEGCELLDKEGVLQGERLFEAEIECRYERQNYELPIPVTLPITWESIKEMKRRFHEEHERTYGYRNEGLNIQMVNYRLHAIGEIQKPVLRKEKFVKDIQKLPDPKEMRMVLYEGAAERMNTPVYNRDEMVPGIELSGPAIIEEMDSTTVIPPRWIARIDEYNNIRLAYEGDK